MKNGGHHRTLTKPEVSDDHCHGQGVGGFERLSGLPAVQLVRLEHRGDGELDLWREHSRLLV